MTPREVLLDAVFVRLVNERPAPQTATAFGTLGLTEVAATSAGAQDLATRSDLKALGDRFFGFDAFGTTHKIRFLLKKDAQYNGCGPACKP